MAEGVNKSPLELLDISSCDLGVRIFCLRTFCSHFAQGVSLTFSRVSAQIKSVISVCIAGESPDCKLSHLYLVRFSTSFASFLIGSENPWSVMILSQDDFLKTTFDGLSLGC